jgi:hypothetical protein
MGKRKGATPARVPSASRATTTKGSGVRPITSAQAWTHSHRRKTESARDQESRAFHSLSKLASLVHSRMISVLSPGASCRERSSCRAPLGRGHRRETVSSAPARWFSGVRSTWTSKSRRAGGSSVGAQGRWREPSVNSQSMIGAGSSTVSRPGGRCAVAGGLGDSRVLRSAGCEGCGGRTAEGEALLGTASLGDATGFGGAGRAGEGL